ARSCATATARAPASAGARTMTRTAAAAGTKTTTMTGRTSTAAGMGPVRQLHPGGELDARRRHDAEVLPRPRAAVQRRGHRGRDARASGQARRVFGAPAA